MCIVKSNPPPPLCNSPPEDTKTKKSQLRLETTTRPLFLNCTNTILLSTPIYCLSIKRDSKEFCPSLFTLHAQLFSFICVSICHFCPYINFHFVLLYFYVLLLVDVCQIHTVLKEGDRDVSNRVKGSKCDKDLTPDWYRFLNVPGIRMSTSCPDKYRCGTVWPIWLESAHPTVDEGIVKRDICIHKNNCCDPKIYNIEVKNCSSFYVYKLQPAPACPCRYCYTFN